MQSLITTEGLSVLEAGQYDRIQTFKLGTSFNYVPNGTDDDIRGTQVYTGDILEVSVLSASQVKITCVLPATVGPFDYGEIAFFLDNDNLFAVSVFGSLQKKNVAAVDPDGEGLRIDSYIQVSGGGASLRTGTSRDKIPALISHTELTSPLDASNAYVFPNPTDGLKPVFAYSHGTVWSFAGFYKAEQGLTTTHSATGFTLPVVSSNFVAGRLVQYLSGENKGLVRKIQTVTAGLSSTAISLDKQVFGATAATDIVAVYAELPAQIEDIEAALAPENSTASVDSVLQDDFNTVGYRSGVSSPKRRQINLQTALVGKLTSPTPNPLQAAVAEGANRAAGAYFIAPSNDDWSAIATALVWAKANAPSVVQFAAGAYSYTDPWPIIDFPVTVQGEGEGRSVLNFALSSGETAIVVNRSTQIVPTVLRELKLVETGSTAGTTAIKMHGSSTVNSDVLFSPELHNVSFLNFDLGAHFRTVQYAKAINCSAYTGSGFLVEGQSVDVKLTNCNFYGDGYGPGTPTLLSGVRTGLYIGTHNYTTTGGVLGPEAVIADGLTVLSAKTGIRVSDTLVCIVTNFVLDYITETGVEIGANCNGGLTFENGWISLHGSGAMAGMYQTYAASLATVQGLISVNRVQFELSSDTAHTNGTLGATTPMWVRTNGWRVRDVTAGKLCGSVYAGAPFKWGRGIWISSTDGVFDGVEVNPSAIHTAGEGIYVDPVGSGNSIVNCSPVPVGSTTTALLTEIVGAMRVSSLPTSNPGAGLVWNDGGTLKVGT